MECRRFYYTLKMNLRRGMCIGTYYRHTYILLNLNTAVTQYEEQQLHRRAQCSRLLVRACIVGPHLAEPMKVAKMYMEQATTLLEDTRPYTQPSKVEATQHLSDREAAVALYEQEVKETD